MITYSTVRMSDSQVTLGTDIREIAVSGLLDSNTAFSHGSELREFVTQEGGRVLLDLSELQYLSSAGVRVLIQCAKDLHAAGGELHLAASKPRVMAVLTIIGFAPTFEVHRTVEEAREALVGAAMMERLTGAVH